MSAAMREWFAAAGTFLISSWACTASAMLVALFVVLFVNDVVIPWWRRRCPMCGRRVRNHYDHMVRNHAEPGVD